MPSKEKPLYDLSLPSLGSIGFIVAAYLYLAGWSNCYWFLKYFGISINAVNIQFYYIFIYSIRVIFTWAIFTTFWGCSFCATVLCICILTFLRPFKYKQHILVILLIILIPVLFERATEVGRFTAEQVQKGAGHSVVVVLKNTVDSEFSKEFMKDNEEEKLRLLTMTQDKLYVYRQQDSKTNELSGYIYEIPRAEVFLTRIEVKSSQEDTK